MKRAIALSILLLVAATAGAQGRIQSPRNTQPGRSFNIPRTLNNNPIHPRATRTYGPIPFPPADRAWIRIDTPHFILFTSGRERAARSMADDFEKLTALLLRISPFFQLPEERTRVFIFNERRDVQPYLNATRWGQPVDAIGVTVRHAGGSTMLLDAGARGGDVATPRHELVHDLLRHNERPLPLWVEEGVAEYYSNSGMPILEHVSRILRGRLNLPVTDMFAMKSSDARAFSADFYAESWATVSMLQRRDQHAFFEMLRDLERGADTAAAIHKHFGLTVAQIPSAMRKAAAPSAPLHGGEAGVTAQVRPVERAELLYQLATMLANVAGGNDEADRHYRAALAAAPKNLEAHVRYAEFLAERDRMAEARLLAEAGLAFAPDEPRLYAVIGTDTREVATLQCARERLPQRRDLDFHLFTAYLHHGDRPNADALFGALMETPRANDARRVLLRTDIARADAFAREGNIVEAVRVLRELAERMPGKTRTELQEQAARLEKLN